MWRAPSVLTACQNRSVLVEHADPGTERFSRLPTEFIPGSPIADLQVNSALSYTVPAHSHSMVSSRHNSLNF
jgi:hypothetical protein